MRSLWVNGYISKCKDWKHFLNAFECYQVNKNVHSVFKCFTLAAMFI